MTIHLSSDNESLVRSLIEAGRYPSEAAVIDEALRLLQERDDQAKLDQLRRDVAIGIEQIDRGESGPFDPQATLARIRARRSSAD
jgi:antitoxin ParD1/3/4